MDQAFITEKRWFCSRIPNEFDFLIKVYKGEAVIHLKTIFYLFEEQKQSQKP